MSGISKDIIVLPELTDNGVRWVVMNIFSRTSLGVNHEALRVLFEFNNLPVDPQKSRIDGEPFQVWDIEYFSNEGGLLADPTRYRRDVSKWGGGRKTSLPELIEEYKKHWLIITEPETYLEKFKRKKSSLDATRFGNYHDQIGSHLLLERRLKPERWWVEQKFETTSYTVRKDNLYGTIQEPFLRSYLPKKIMKNSQVLDIGCGVGFYSNLMANCGARVIGLDPNRDYIEIACKNAVAGAEFKCFPLGKTGALQSIPNAFADTIFMSDTLLFYFVSILPNERPNIDELLQEIRRILKPGGTFISLESHPIFYQAPWLGSSNRPYTIKTEYRHHTYGITPTLEELIQSFNRAGFGVTWMTELYPESQGSLQDDRAYHFAAEYPLWLLCELKVVLV